METKLVKLYFKTDEGFLPSEICYSSLLLSCQPTYLLLKLSDFMPSESFWLSIMIFKSNK